MLLLCLSLYQASRSPRNTIIYVDLEKVPWLFDSSEPLMGSSFMLDSSTKIVSSLNNMSAQYFLILVIFLNEVGNMSPRQ